MSKELKLSDVIEDLSRASRIGVEIKFCLYGAEEIYNLDDHDFESPPLILELTCLDQALIIASLEQYIESKPNGVEQWLETSYSPKVGHLAHIWQEVPTKIGSYIGGSKGYVAPTRLQAALQAFLHVFGGNDVKD